MLRLHSNWLLLACAATVVLTAPGCSVDPDRNAGRRKACALSAGDEPYKGFCVSADNGAGRDGGADAGDEPDRPCEEEGAVELCYEGDPSTASQPPCRAGTRTCEGGYWTRCEGQKRPEEEVCNGMDDNCNGETDEQIATADCVVEEQHGACQQGVHLCMAGGFACIPVVFPKAEVCNGIDDDCDGLSDEQDPDLIEACYPPDTAGCVLGAGGVYNCTGLCKTGSLRCVDGRQETTCVGAVLPTEEVGTVPDGVVEDEDCDGESDEGFECTPGENYSCYAGPAGTRGVGPCAAGSQPCTEEGTLGECEGQVLPVPETCANDGADNDCNGKQDDIPSRYTSCGNPGSDNQCTANARWDCDDGTFACLSPAAKDETCDGVDNDCDNDVDEDFDFATDPNHCGGCNLRCADGLTCCNGTCVSTQASNNHCGACGNACESGRTCCSASCVNTRNDVKNCGVCGKVCPSTLGLLGSCGNGVCSFL